MRLSLFLVAALVMGCNQQTEQALTRSSQGQTESQNPGTGGGGTPPANYTLSVVATSASILSGASTTLNVTNGQAPYTYRVSRGAGAVSASTFTAGMVPGRATIEATDARGAKGTVNVAVTPNDTRFAMLYGLHNPGNDADIDALEAWDIQTDCRTILVGVIDTGSDLTHPDLMANLWTNPNEIANNGVDDDANGRIDDIKGWDFVNDDNSPMDDNLHGTHVAGTIGAVSANGVGVAGVCNRANIATLKFLDDAGGGAISDALDAFDYARRIQAKVLNNSWGLNPYNPNDPNLPANQLTQLNALEAQMSTAIGTLNANGIFFAAAAGNSAVNTDTFKALPGTINQPNVISIAATNNTDTIATFSNRGTNSVKIAAPGVNILSTFPVTATAEMLDPAGDGSQAPFNTSYEMISGTSMATPHVAGAAALVWANKPTLTHIQLRDTLYTNADTRSTLTGLVNGTRRLNVMRALDPNFPRP